MGRNVQTPLKCRPRAVIFLWKWCLNGKGYESVVLSHAFARQRTVMHRAAETFAPFFTDEIQDLDEAIAMQKVCTAFLCIMTQPPRSENSSPQW